MIATTLSFSQKEKKKKNTIVIEQRQYSEGLIFLIYDCIKLYKGLPGAKGVKNPLPMQEIKELRVQSRVNWEDLLEKKWQPTLVFLPGKSHGQRSLVGYSPWGLKELDTTERLHFLSLSGFLA